MLNRMLTSLASSRRKKRTNRRNMLEVAPLEGRWLLSTGDLTTAATVATFTRGVATVQPMKAAYATNADSVRVGFSASDPDDSGSTATTHFTVTDTTTGTVVIKNGTGTSFTLSKQDVYRVQFWSTDSDDSEPVNAHSILVAIDRAGPAVTISTVNPNVLWPPNGKFVTVTVTGVATDSLSGVALSSLRFHVVDEYGRVEPSGAITRVTTTEVTPFGGFENVGFSFRVELQARRFGFDFDGRQYVIDVTANDVAGNSGQGSAGVVVPHDMGRHHGFHKSAHPGMPSGTGVRVHRHGLHHHGGKHGKTGFHERHGAASSPTSGGGTVVGKPRASGGHRGGGNGNDQGNGNDNGNGKEKNGNGKGKNSNGNGNGNDNGQG
jgi:hypothetical protein